jgi:hypothetical protein
LYSPAADYPFQTGSLPPLQNCPIGIHSIGVAFVAPDIETGYHFQRQFLDQGKNIVLAVAFVESAKALHAPISDANQSRVCSFRRSRIPERLVKSLFADRVSILHFHSTPDLPDWTDGL